MTFCNVLCDCTYTGVAAGRRIHTQLNSVENCYISGDSGARSCDATATNCLFLSTKYNKNVKNP